MPFNFLLWNCLAVGRTSVAEKGITARMERKPGESVLAFRIDCDEFRRHFGTRRVCDALFFYRSQENKPVLLFVELKGSNIRDGVEQLKETLGIIEQALKDYPADYRAIVVTDAGGLKSAKGLQREFQKTHKVTLSVGRESDLRTYL